MPLEVAMMTTGDLGMKKAMVVVHVQGLVVVVVVGEAVRVGPLREAMATMTLVLLRVATQHESWVLVWKLKGVPVPTQRQVHPPRRNPEARASHKDMRPHEWRHLHVIRGPHERACGHGKMQGCRILTLGWWDFRTWATRVL